MLALWLKSNGFWCLWLWLVSHFTQLNYMSLVVRYLFQHFQQNTFLKVYHPLDNSTESTIN